MPRRFRKALMDFTGAKTYEECRDRFTILSKERIDNIPKALGLPVERVTCVICNAWHTHGYLAKFRGKDGIDHYGTIADAKDNGCKTLHFGDDMGNGNRNAEHDHDGPPPKSKESIEESTCLLTGWAKVAKKICRWWVRILRRRRSKIKKHSVCRMFMKLKAYKRLRSIYKAKKCFAKIPMHNLADWLRSWIKEWHLQQRIDRQNKIRDMTITNLEKRANEKKEMVFRRLNYFRCAMISSKIKCEQYLVKKQSEQKRQAFKMLCKPWQRTQEQIKEERSKKTKEAKLENSQNHKHNQDRLKKMFRKH